MIITDRFVLINFPKTGSTFVRDALKRAHHQYPGMPRRILAKLGSKQTRRMIELFLPEINEQSNLGAKHQHGTCRQIPEEHRDKPVVSVARNPLDRYVSTYLFGWWRMHPPAPENEIKRTFPGFPDLSFEEYHEMLNLYSTRDRLKSITPSIPIGVHTIQFIQFYFRDPDNVLATIDDDYIGQRKYRKDMVPVTFLHQENLNQELYDFLLSVGYSESDIGFILKADRTRVTPRKPGQADWTGLYTPGLVQEVLARDRLLYDIFPEYRQS